MDEPDFPPHAWERDETIFTEEDDLNTPAQHIPDEELTSLDADAGVDLLIRAAQEAGDG